MRLRTALNTYKRDHSERFPGESPTTSGAFSGHGDRLVHIGHNGALRDYSAALSGLHGIDRSRFAIEANGNIQWFDQLETVRQHYYQETTLVETEYDAGEFTVHQFDLTLGRAHLTHVELRGAVPTDAQLTAFVTLAPEGRETQVARLIHEQEGPNNTKAVEVFHRHEHDYITASTGLSDVRGQVPEGFDEILSSEPFEYPRDGVIERFEDTHLSGDIVVSAPLELSGRAAQTTLVTQLSDHREMTRREALDDLQYCASQHRNDDDIRSAAKDRAGIRVSNVVPRKQTVQQDLRALSLLTAPSGAHIAGPEFDPFYENSGGYGYTWFRDEAECAKYLLASDQLLDIDLESEYEDIVSFFIETQLSDGTWPHRVWAIDGSLAPGWANARLEGSDKPEYQADQTASVITFLARILTTRRESLTAEEQGHIERAIDDGVSGLNDSVGGDNLPERCQNAWENMVGQFTHTAATFLEAYAAVSQAPVESALQRHATEQAKQLFDGISQLWSESTGHYVMRLDDGDEDHRLDSSTLSLTTAFARYDEAVGLPTRALSRLESHLRTTLTQLHRRSSDQSAGGLIRFEDDYWRSGDQHKEKVWSVSTAWGSTAAAEAATIFESHDRAGVAAEFLSIATELYEYIQSDGTFSTEMGYLAEQAFDDGSLDSAAPLAWPHSLRLHATGLLAEKDALPAPKPSPSGPTTQPRWTTGEKYGVGTVADHNREDSSRVWFTLTEGSLTEIRFPRVDLMNFRTIDLLVVDTDEETEYTARSHNETRVDDTSDTVRRRAEIVDTEALMFRHVITETGDGRGHQWTLTAEYAADPNHDALLTEIEFNAHDENEYEVYVIANTALTNTGATDRGLRVGQTGDYQLVSRATETYQDEAETKPLLIDENGEEYSVAVALTTTTRFDWATVGIAGSSTLSEFFGAGVEPEPEEQLDDENIVLVGLLGSGETVTETLSIGFAEEADTAGALGEAAGALTRGYETVRSEYIQSWQEFLADKSLPKSVQRSTSLAEQYTVSLMTLRAVEDKTFLGAGIASPSVPWGVAVNASEAKGYGYNFVWSRDLYQVFTVFEAVGDLETATQSLEFIYEYQQDSKGFIPQNTYLNGRTRWGGEQMDNISFPQVMAWMLYDSGLTFDDVEYSYHNVRRSADYVAYNGPQTAQERWEEESGYSPSSIAAEIAGLVCAADIAVQEDHLADGLIWAALADSWTADVESWTATETGTKRHQHTPYYVRVTRHGDPDAGQLRTLANNGPTLDEREIIDAGFLELVRLGIKSPDDTIVRNSIKEVDNTIRVDLPEGPAFYRYNGDGYGERAVEDEGAPWSIDAKGKGRLWPIFTGERGEYELRRGAEDGSLEPRNLLETMSEFANSGRMIAEQVWDRQHSTDYNWELGEGTGAATPLAWSMAQYVRLAHGIDAGEPVEMPQIVADRYQESSRPEGPTLEANTRYLANKLVVSGRSDAAMIAVKTPSETKVIEPTGDSFEVALDIEFGEDQVIVAAASTTDLSTAGTSVRRFTL